MSVITKRRQILNALVYVKDASSEEFPNIDGSADLWVLPSCIAVGCLPDSDGDTEIRIGLAKDVGTNKLLAFDGLLETPSRTVVVESVLAERLVEMRVRGVRTRVQIWTNGHRDTDIVIIGLG